jgi:hypothetical protein
MATSFHNAVLGAHNAIRSSRGLAVTYRRGSSEVSLTAVAGRTRVSAENESGLLVESRQRDWLVRAADLLFGSQSFRPEVGDLVRLEEGPDVQDFEVQRLAGESCYEACDDLGHVLRIHSRQVKTAEA